MSVRQVISDPSLLTRINLPSRKVFEGPHIKVLVGPPDQPFEFCLSKALLCLSSTYFKVALKGDFREAKENVIHLDDEDAQVFRAYATWLVTKKLTRKDTREGLSCLGYEQHLLNMYLFADKRGIAAFGNAVITLLASWTFEAGTVSPQSLARVYDLLPPDSKLRQFLVDDEVAYRIRLRNLKALDLYEYPEDFVLGVIQTEFSSDEKPKRPCDHICDYHEHADDKSRKNCPYKRKY